jgi:hypothetical protein
MAADAPSRDVSPGAVRTALQGALDAWNSQPGLPLRLMLEADVAEPVPGVVVRFVQSGWRHDAARVGHTDFEADPSSGTLYSAAIEIDEQHHRFFAGHTGAHGSAYDLEAVLTHELGHALGLGHSAEPGAAMRGLGHSGDEAARGVSDDDRAGLRSLYEGGQPLESVPEPVLPGPARPSEAGSNRPPPCLRNTTSARADHRSYVIGPCEARRRARAPSSPSAAR